MGEEFQTGGFIFKWRGRGCPLGGIGFDGRFSKETLGWGWPCPMPIPPAMGNPALNAIWKTPIYKTLWPLLVDGVQLLQGYTETLWGDSLLFTRNSWYSLNQSRKDERLRWPWSHPVVLNLCINLVITKYKLKSQYVKLTQLWALTVNCFKVNSQSYLAGLSKMCFLCTYVDQMILQ